MTQLLDNLELLNSLGDDFNTVLKGLDKANGCVYPLDDNDNHLVYDPPDKAVRYPLWLEDDPEGATRKWLASVDWDKLTNGVLTCIGTGDGLYLELLPEYAPPGMDLVIVEPVAPIFAAAALYRDLRPLWQTCRTHVVLSSEKHAVATYLRTAPLYKLLQRSTHLLVHPVAEHYAEGFARQFFDRLQLEVNAISINRNTNEQKVQTLLPHTCANLPALAASAGTSALINAFQDRPAIIVSPGPSLEDDLDTLRGLQDKALIIAVDTALRTLLANDIHPHLTVALDMSPGNARHFHDLDVPASCWLAFEPMIHPSMPPVFGERRLAGLSWQPPGSEQGSARLIHWLCEAADFAPGRLVGLGSTSTAAFGLAFDLGCNPLVLVGQDLAYPGRRQYAAGTAPHDTPAGEPELIKAKSVTGGLVPTTQIFLLFAQQLNRLMTTTQRTVYNSSRRGLQLDAAENRPLADIPLADTPHPTPPGDLIARLAANWRQDHAFNSARAVTSLQWLADIARQAETLHDIQQRIPETLKLFISFLDTRRLKEQHQLQTAIDDARAAGNQQQADEQTRRYNALRHEITRENLAQLRTQLDLAIQGLQQLDA